MRNVEFAAYTYPVAPRAGGSPPVGPFFPSWPTIGLSLAQGAPLVNNIYNSFAAAAATLLSMAPAERVLEFIDPNSDLTIAGTYDTGLGCVWIGSSIAGHFLDVTIENGVLLTTPPSRIENIELSNASSVDVCTYDLLGGQFTLDLVNVFIDSVATGGPAFVNFIDSVGGGEVRFNLYGQSTVSSGAYRFATGVTAQVNLYDTPAIATLAFVSADAAAVTVNNFAGEEAKFGQTVNVIGEPDTNPSYTCVQAHPITVYVQSDNFDYRNNLGSITRAAQWLGNAAGLDHTIILPAGDTQVILGTELLLGAGYTLKGGSDDEFATYTLSFTAGATMNRLPAVLENVQLFSVTDQTVMTNSSNNDITLLGSAALRGYIFGSPSVPFLVVNNNLRAVLCDASFIQSTIGSFCVSGSGAVTCELFDSAAINARAFDSTLSSIQIKALGSGNVVDVTYLQFLTFTPGVTVSSNLNGTSPNDVSASAMVGCSTLIDPNYGRTWTSNPNQNAWYGVANEVTFTPGTVDGPTTFVTFSQLAKYIASNPNEVTIFVDLDGVSPFTLPASAYGMPGQYSIVGLRDDQGGYPHLILTGTTFPGPSNIIFQNASRLVTFRDIILTCDLANPLLRSGPGMTLNLEGAFENSDGILLNCTSSSFPAKIYMRDIAGFDTSLTVPAIQTYFSTHNFSLYLEGFNVVPSGSLDPKSGTRIIVMSSAAALTPDYFSHTELVAGVIWTPFLTSLDPSVNAPFAGVGCMVSDPYADPIPKLWYNATVGGVATWVNIADASQMTYTPASGANWSGTPPTSVKNALDRIAAKITPIP